jgi:serine/threonine protein kinase
VVAWELLTARRLFRGDHDLETIRMVRSDPIPRPSSINRSCPSGLDVLVLRCLERDRDQRWASAAEMRSALETVRRPYRDQSGSREVALWKQAMLGERRADPDAPRNRDTDNETTIGRLRFDDLEDVVDERLGADPPGDERSELEIEMVVGGDTIDEPGPPRVTFSAAPSGVIAHKTLELPAEPPPPEHQTLEEESPWHGTTATRDTVDTAGLPDDTS